MASRSCIKYKRGNWCALCGDTWWDVSHQEIEELVGELAQANAARHDLAGSLERLHQLLSQLRAKSEAIRTRLDRPLTQCPLCFSTDYRTSTRRPVHGHDCPFLSDDAEGKVEHKHRWEVQCPVAELKRGEVGGIRSLMRVSYTLDQLQCTCGITADKVEVK